MNMNFARVAIVASLAVGLFPVVVSAQSAPGMLENVRRGQTVLVVDEPVRR